MAELETELQETDVLRSEMEQVKADRDELQDAVTNHKCVMENWEEERDEERKAYEAKLQEVMNFFIP